MRNHEQTLSRRDDGLIEEVEASEGGVPVWIGTYGYDRSHRLSESERTAGGLTAYSHTYDHDPNGNIISLDGDVRIVHPPTGRLTWNSGDGCIYDANGALVECTDPTRTLALEWDACGGRLERVLVDRVAGDETVAEYTYDYAGRRIGKRVCTGEGIAACPEGTGTETKYVWTGDQLLAEMDGNKNIKRIYTWHGKRQLFVTDFVQGVEHPVAENHAVVSDWRGAPHEVVRLSNGQVLWRADYEDFGKLASLDPDVDGNSTNFIYNWRFAGQYYDAESDWYYNNQRYYDPETGRYISKDPIGYNGGSLNLYGYTGANPVNRIDFTGLGVVELLAGYVLHPTHAESLGIDIEDKDFVFAYQAANGSGLTPMQVKEIADHNEALTSTGESFSECGSDIFSDLKKSLKILGKSFGVVGTLSVPLNGASEIGDFSQELTDEIDSLDTTPDKFAGRE